MFRPNIRIFTIALTVVLLSNSCNGGIFNTVGNLIKNGGDIIKTGAEVVVGNAMDAVHSIPTPIEHFEKSKNYFISLPLEVAFNVINQLCSASVSSNTLKSHLSVDLNRMNFQLRTACNRHDYPLLNSTEMWNSPDFDPSKKVVVYASGWGNKINDSESIDKLAKAYSCRGDVNFIAVDAANFVDTLYTWSALNTEEIGGSIAQGLVQLAEIVPLENIHLIGHSLGAHIMGAAARNFSYTTGKSIPRITALDPARPCFNEGETLSGLMRGDADFIDVIHSNPGILGKREPLGDVDFYPGGLGALPLGCNDISSAHSRSWKYYAETIYRGNELGFLAVRCGSLTQLQQGKCPGVKVPMGYVAPSNFKGNYFLKLNHKSPFGKASTVDPEKTNCGLCQTREA